MSMIRDEDFWWVLSTVTIIPLCLAMCGLRAWVIQREAKKRAQKQGSACPLQYGPVIQVDIMRAAHGVTEPLKPGAV
jgi:hypothetical protein